MSTLDNLSKGNVSLTAVSADQMAEVFLINSNLDLVDRGIGTLKTKQPPGVYKIKVRSGQATHETLVALEKQPVKVKIDHLKIPSAAPLEATGQSHEYHQAAIMRHVGTPWVTVGSGASLFVFARYWTAEGVTVQKQGHPARGLTLRRLDGSVVVDFEESSRADLNPDAWAACNVEIDPGTYLLAVEKENGDVFEMSLCLPRDWRTQVFLLQKSESSVGEDGGPVWRPDLPGASIRMAKSGGFGLREKDDRLTELARLALIDGRQVMNQALESMLAEKFRNPMLGIFGGHLILRSPEPDLNLLRIVVHNLRDMFLAGSPHPDVEALALACGMAPVGDFSVPPMLRASWDIVLKKSYEMPELVPRRSLSSQVAARISSQDPWLTWRAGSNLESVLEDFTQLFNETMKQKSGVAGLMKSVALGKETLAQSIGLPQATVSDLISAMKSVAKRSSAKAVADLIRNNQSTIEKLAGASKKVASKRVGLKGAKPKVK